MQNGEESKERGSLTQEGEFISVGYLLGRIGHYRSTILAIVGAIAALYVICALALYVVSPTTTTSKLAFRLDFPNAEKGQYPNGNKFSAAEIVATPILLEVYRQNQLDQFVAFDTFKSSLVVITSNPELDSLIRTYTAKLSDPRLSLAERDQLEREFEEKKESLSRASMSIQMVTTSRLSSIPDPLRAKVLNDVLTVWANQTVQNKGVLLYDISILSSRIFEEDIVKNYDYVVALDLTRSKIDRIIRNIDELLKLPGAKVLRTKSGEQSLEELRVRLVDTQNFRIRPLVGTLLSRGISNNPAPSLEFLRTQLRLTELDRLEAEARVAAIRDALQTYVMERKARSKEGGETNLSTNGTLIPQIDESFLNRITALAADANDLAYRQEMIDDLREASMKVVPLDAETRYYETLLAAFVGSVRRPTEAEKTSIEEQIRLIHEEAVRTTDQVNEIYAQLSEDLNPSTALYSATTPPTRTSARGVSPKMLALTGLLLLLMSLPFVTVCILVYDNVRANAASAS